MGDARSATIHRAWADEVKRAASRVYPYVHKTRLLHDFGGIDAIKTRVFYKLECEQITGSFKARGAVNKLSALTEAGDASTGIVTASTGNHARATAYALSVLPHCATLPAKIYLPRTVSPVKLAKLQASGVPLVIVDADDCADSEAAAARAAQEEGAVFVSPYNDPAIIGGQGTAGVEILQQLHEIDSMYSARARHGSPADRARQGPACRPLIVIVPVGGGGLIAGVATAVKYCGDRPSGSVVVLGVQPESNACMFHSCRVGRLLGDAAIEGGLWDNGDTLADGTAGGVEPGSETWHAFTGCGHDVAALERAISAARSVCEGAGKDVECDYLHKPLVDVILTVTEREIEASVAYMLRTHGKVIEGAAGCAVAATLPAGECGSSWSTTGPLAPSLWQGCDVVAVLCGGNISAEKLQHCLEATVVST